MPYKMIFNIDNEIKEIKPLAPDNPKRDLECTDIKLKGELVAKSINKMEGYNMCKVEHYVTL